MVVISKVMNLIILLYYIENMSGWYRWKGCSFSRGVVLKIWMDVISEAMKVYTYKSITYTVVLHYHGNVTLIRRMGFIGKNDELNIIW